MQLIDYLKSMTNDDRTVFAKRCGTSDRHLTNVAYGYKPCGIALAVAIERESAGSVTRKVLRGDWKLYWPELEPSLSEDARSEENRRA